MPVRALIGFSFLGLCMACASGNISGAEESSAAATSVQGGTSSDPNNPSAQSLAAGTLVVMGRGYLAATNANVYLSITDRASERRLNERSVGYPIQPDGTFRADLPSILTANANYELALYIDKNNNGFCNAPPADIAYVAQFTSLAGASVLTVNDTGAMISACHRFGDFNFTFDSHMGLSEGHPGHTVYGVLSDASDRSIVGPIQYDVVQSSPNSGQASFAWHNTLLEGHSYYFAICVDDNQNNLCDANIGADHQFYWLENQNSTGGIQGHIDETFVLHHETNRLVTDYWPAPASPLPPAYPDVPILKAEPDLPSDPVDTTASTRIKYTAVFDANNALYEHNNLDCYAAVIDVTDPAHGVMVGATQKQMVLKGALRLSWPSILEPGHSYVIAAFSDVKKDATCAGTPGSEPQWVIALPFVASDATAYFAHQSRKASCLYFPSGPL